MTTPHEGHCARCGQPRMVFPANPERGRVPTPLCTSDWQRYAVARASKAYVDFNDAFDNATDQELEDRFAESGL